MRATETVPIASMMPTTKPNATMTSMDSTVCNRASPTTITCNHGPARRRHRIYCQNDRRPLGAGAHCSVRPSNASATAMRSALAARRVRTPQPPPCRRFCNATSKRNATPIKMSSTNCDTIPACQRHPLPTTPHRLRFDANARTRFGHSPLPTAHCPLI